MRDLQVGFDAFDHPKTLAALLPKLIRSHALDALDTAPPCAPFAGVIPEAERFLAETAAASAEPFPALGLGEDEITQVLLAGSFGSYLSPASAVRIGLVPKLALPRIISAGNVAGEGAKMAALSLRERAAADAILDEVEYVELSGRADFNDMFMDELAFPG